MNLSRYMLEKKKIIDRYLDEMLFPDDRQNSEIHRAIRYSVLDGGKRIRPILTIMTAEMLGKPGERVLPTAAGIELIHTFSLVHDDLPCMDNDDFRRGKLTSHKVFGEAMAVLTGDALLVMGLDSICRNAEVAEIRKESVILVLQDILAMLGTEKMLGGQVDDISWHQDSGDLDSLRNLYLKKTSALICASLKAGAILSRADRKQIEALNRYGEKIGLAFQITDDLFDLQQDKKDENRASLPKIIWVEKAKDEAYQLCQQAKESLSLFGDEAQLFYELADFIINRKE